MRFFKYLVFIFISSISHHALAASCTANGAGHIGTGSSPDETCKALYKKAISEDVPTTLKALMRSDGTGFDCSAFAGNAFGAGSCTSSCPPTVHSNPLNVPGWTNWDYEQVVRYRNIYVNQTVCYKGCRYKEPSLAGSDPEMQLLFGNPVEDSSCPNTETKPNTPEPPDDPTCGKFCEKPPNGCPPGYLTGSFNNKQICYKSSPNTPNPNDPNNNPPEEPEQPQQPNACSAANCPKPDADKDCPTGYYPSTHNGEAICIRNNPNPNQPNPNDPNNNVPPSSEPVGTGDPDAKGIIDSIKALRDSLLGAIDSVSRKLTALTDGQKTTNEHLKNIKEQSTKSNEHLKKIEDGTAAASESLGDIKDYLTDESGAAISSVALPTEGISVGQIDYNIFKVNAQCPVSPNLLVTLSHTSKSFGIEYSQLCDILQYMGYLIGLVGLLHAGQILVRDS